MPQRKFLVATEILVFDFELFIGALREFHSDFRLTAGRWSSTGDMN
jgi:hypothetical protein